jgi:hypothetical protein
LSGPPAVYFILSGDLGNSPKLEILEGERMKRAAPFLFTLLLCGPLTFCQEQEPTYEQTKKWLVSKITDEAGTTIRQPGAPPLVSPSSITTSYENVSMDDCKLQFARVTFSSGFNISSTAGSTQESPSVTTEVVLIPLNKVSSVERLPHVFLKSKDGQTVLVDDYPVRINTTSKVIVKKSTEKQGDRVVSQDAPAPTDNEGISFGRSSRTDKETAGRVLKALLHAVNLCKQFNEKEPF